MVSHVPSLSRLVRLASSVPIGQGASHPYLLPIGENETEMLEYENDSLSPDYNVGGNITFGPGGISGGVSAGVTNAPGVTPGCVNCTGGRFLNLSLPIILIALAVIVLMLRK